MIGQVVGLILKLIAVTFGLLIFLFLLTYFPDEQVAAFAGGVLSAFGSILGAIPPIVEFVVQRITGG